MYKRKPEKNNTEVADLDVYSSFDSVNNTAKRVFNELFKDGKVSAERVEDPVDTTPAQKVLAQKSTPNMRKYILENASSYPLLAGRINPTTKSHQKPTVDHHKTTQKAQPPANMKQYILENA